MIMFKITISTALILIMTNAAPLTVGPTNNYPLGFWYNAKWDKPSDADRYISRMKENQQWGDQYMSIIYKISRIQ